MRRTFSLINQNCRCATRLVCESHDRPLTHLERTGLSIHLLGCRSCRRYRDQVKFLDELIKSESKESEATLPDAARQRIAGRLTDAAG